MQVSLRYCDNYDFDILKATLDESVASLGGWGKYIAPGDRVLVKPNLLTKKKPDEAVTTHPVFVKALVSLLIEHGASVVIGDSPGGPFTNALLTGVYRATGMEDIANETGATLNRNFGSFTADNPRGAIMKKLTLVDMINDVDKIICVAKLKTHAMMTYTGAVKNMFGMVPGISKAEYHLNIPDYEKFADALVDICLACEPVLSFIDGIIGMEGNGPAAGMPVHTGAVMVSPSPYHLDLVACKMIGLTPKDVPMLRRMIARGMVDEEMLDIDFTSERMTRFTARPYVAAETKGVINVVDLPMPKFLKNFIAKYVQTRPVFKADICNGCGVCKEACPVDIIKIKESQATLNYRDCIRCYCCQELCPRHAIHVHRPKLSRLLKF